MHTISRLAIARLVMKNLETTARVHDRTALHICILELTKKKKIRRIENSLQNVDLLYYSICSNFMPKIDIIQEFLQSSASRTSEI